MEFKNPSELSKFIDLLRKKGVKSFKSDKFEIELREEAPPSHYKRKVTSLVPMDPTIEPQYTEDDLIDWSSPHRNFEGG